MRIRLSALLAGVLGATLFFYAVLGVTYARQQQDKNAIEAQLIQLRPALSQTRPDPTELEDRLAAAQAKLAAEQASFPEEVSSTELSDWVLQIAQETQLKALLLRANPISSEKRKGYTYKVLRVEIEANGSFSQLADFIRRLEEGKFKTLVLERASLAVATADVAAHLKLALYARTQPPATGTPNLK